MRKYKKNIRSFFRFFSLFFCIAVFSFSNIPFYTLTGLIGSLERTSDIVDNFSSVKNFAKKLEIPKAMAAMSIRSVGAYVNGTANLTPVIPATAAAGDMMLLAYGTKPYNDAPTIDQGWLSIGSATNGTVAAGVDVGSMQTRIFYKIHTGSEVNPTVTNGTNNVSGAVIIVFQKAANEMWVTPVGAGGGDATAGTGFSVTASSNPGITAGDMLVGYAAIRSDAGTQSGIGITATGLTVGAFTESPATDLTTTAGGDMAMSGGYRSVTAGTASAAPVYASTLAASHTGSAFIVRLRVQPAVTTISNFVSGEPGNSTIAPAVSGMVDSFGLATDTGTDTVTAATVGLTAGMGQYIQTVAITNDGDTVTYCSAAPSGDTAALSTCGISVSTTNTQFKIKLTAKAHTAMPAPDGGLYNVTATVTGFTSTNGQAGTDSGSSTLTIDNDSPAGTTGANATSGENAQSTVSWTPPGDGDFQQVYIYCKTSSMLSGEAPTEGTDPAVDATACDATARMKYKGTASPQTITGLTNGQIYYFRIYARDTNGNFTAYAATQEVSATPSAPVATLTISQTAGSKYATRNSGDVNQYAHDETCSGAATCAAFTLAASGGAVNVTSIKITESGTVTANTELSDLNLYYDNDGNWSDAGAETLFGTAATFAADQTATVSGALNISSGQTAYIYVRYDLVNAGTYPTGGATVNFQIAAAGDVVSNVTESGSGTLAGTQTVRPNVTNVTNSSLGDGGRNGETFTITGAGFGTVCASISVQVEGTALTCNSANNTTISATIPATQITTYGGAGASGLLVTVGGTADDARQTYYVYPSVNLVSTPLVANAAREGENITLTNSTANASRFGATQGTVTFSGGFGSVAGSIVSWGDTSIGVTVPAGIGDNVYLGDITVTRNADAKTDLAYDSNGFRVLPKITGFTPGNGEVGAAVQVDGNHFCQNGGTCPLSFDASNKVTFTSAVDATVFTGWTATAMNTQVPAGAATGNVVLKSNGYDSNGSNFAVNVPTPTTPTNLKQSRNSGFTNLISVGGIASSTPVYFSGDTSSTVTGGTMYLQVEMRPTTGGSSAFTGTCSGNGYCFEGPGFAYSGGTITATSSTSTANDLYHWQTRARYNKSSTDYFSNWQCYPSSGCNSENATDLKVDTAAPVISNIIETPSMNGGTIAWATDELATTQLEYGTNSGLVGSTLTAITDTPAETNGKTSGHSVSISNLTCATIYYYRARSRDAGTIEGTTGILDFTTSACPSQPAKTAVFHIVGATGPISAATTYYFTIPAPEISPSIKNAYVEITGLVSGGSNPIGVQVNAVGAGSYAVSATNPSYYRFVYKVTDLNTSPTPENVLNLNDIAPCTNGNAGAPPCNKLVITPGSGMTINITSAKLIITYAYTP